MRSSSAPTSSDMPHLNAGFEPDIDRFLDLDQDAVRSPSKSPNIRSKSSVSQSSNGSEPGNSQPQQTFAGPSFQYDSYKQQTGLPLGALANTFALNEAIGMQYNGYGNGFIMPAETLNVPLTNLDEFDFAAYPAMDMDMDLEADSPTDNMFYPTASTAKGSFFDPNVLLGQENASSSNSAPAKRMYPGMHSQLAAQAKAQQAQKESAPAQQSRQMPHGQHSLPQASKAKHIKDPHVEESISRLLNRMRQSSVASVDDEASTPTASLPHLAKMKKDEDGMDEDERLLASEEGKKLSSKERRQLRNKVSARAFRSRRKEYIGQLEGEIAIKTQEANELKVRNRELVEENTRLTDLTRMLLSSQAFSSFLSELSGTAPPPSTNLEQSKPQVQPQPSSKDINPHQAARQLENQPLQIGLAAIPESAVDLPLVDHATSISTWNSNIGLNSFPVYSLTEVPYGPPLDIQELSGKGHDGFSLPAVDTIKRDVPIIDYPPCLLYVEEVGPPSCTIHIDPDTCLNETAFALYAEPPLSPQKALTPLVPASQSLFDANNANCQLDVILDADDDGAGAASRLAMMCSRLDAISARVAALTSHLN